jgi:uncharacterized membrane protein YphA (DoxX/SURF4 family)
MQEAQILQRLFSTFPGGWPGFGLLLLRLTVGLTTAAEGINYFAAPRASNSGMWILYLVEIAIGFFLVVGFLSPIASIFAAAGNAILAFTVFSAISASLIDVKLKALDAIMVAMAIVFLGPGAFSLDAYFFGRREIIIPDTTGPSRNR